MSQHQTLWAILALAVVYIIMNSMLYMVMSPTYIVLIDIVLYCFVHLGINRKMKMTI